MSETGGAWQATASLRALKTKHQSIKCRHFQIFASINYHSSHANSKSNIY